jgi:broad specificity phosphatase PhoE
MTTVVLIPWADTDWSQAGRLHARAPVSINADGRKRALHWANQLASRELAAVYGSPERPAHQTASVFADRAEVRVRQIQDLQEVDVGLWEGLTEPQIRERYPRVFKQWADDPGSVCPPDGERVRDAADRIRKAIARITHKHRNRTVGVVLGPLALALARCALENRGLGELRWSARPEPLWYEVEIDRRADDRP